MDMLLCLIVMSALICSAAALPVKDSNNDVPSPIRDAMEVLQRERRNAGTCQPPANVDELFRRLNQNVDTSVFLRHVRENNAFLPTELNMDQVEESRYYGSRTCPESINEISDNPQDPLWKRSLCPWYYNVTELPQGHYPRVIPQAVCKCSNCIDNNLNQCERVTTHVRVLEETGCKDGFYTYKPKTVVHYVGCTCARRRTTTPSPLETTTTGAGSPCGPFGCVE